MNMISPVNGMLTDRPPLVTMLTLRPFHPSLRAVADAAAERGVTIRCSRSVDPTTSLVFQWGYPRPAALKSVRQFCDHHGIEYVNAEPRSKWEQLICMADAGLPIPNSRRALNLCEAREARNSCDIPW